MKITIRGTDFGPVEVGDDGIFRIKIQGELYAADTLAGLRNKVMFGLYRNVVEVCVPFSIVQNGVIRHGVATGINAYDDSVSVRWDDDPHHVDAIIDWHHTILERLAPEEHERFRRLIADQWAANNAVAHFERVRTMNLKSLVAIRINMALEKKGTDQ